MHDHGIVRDFYFHGSGRTLTRIIRFKMDVAEKIFFQNTLKIFFLSSSSVDTSTLIRLLIGQCQGKRNVFLLQKSVQTHLDDCENERKYFFFV